MAIDYGIRSRAHTWMQTLPLSDNILVCVDCGHRRPMKKPPGFEKPCRHKWESLTSGYSGPIVATEYDDQRRFVRRWVAGRAGRWPQPWNGGTAMIYGIRWNNRA